MPAASKTSRRALELSTSERLVQATRECLLLDGAAHTSLKSIAARAGINHGLIHRHFGSKEALMVAVHADIDYDIPPLSLESPKKDAKAFMKGLFKDQRLSIELLSLSYQMPMLREAMVRRTRKVLRRYTEQSPGLSETDVVSMGAEIMGLSVYHALDPKMPITEALSQMLRRYFEYPKGA